jgi:hypothetical protein
MCQRGCIGRRRDLGTGVLVAGHCVQSRGSKKKKRASQEPLTHANLVGVLERGQLLCRAAVVCRGCSSAVSLSLTRMFTPSRVRR